MTWRPRTPFYYGWFILGIGTLGTFVSTTVGGLVLGGTQNFILEEMKWRRTTIGLAVTVGVWGSGLLSPLVGSLTDRYGPRWLMPFGTATLGICLFFLSRINSVWQFYLIVIIARAVSQPVLIGVVPRTLAVNFFRRRRNTALALAGMSRPITAAINIQFISLIAGSYGWRTAFQSLSFISLLLTPVFVLLIRRRPEDIGILPDGEKPDQPQPGRSHLEAPHASPPDLDAEVAGGNLAAQTGESEVSWTAREALHTRAFWLVAMATLLAVMASSGLAFNMVPYFQEESNLSAAQATGVLSLSIFLALANLLWGYLADKFTPKWCLVFAMIVAGGMVLFLPTVDSVLSAYVFGVVWGIAVGSLDVLVYTILAQYYGRTSYGTIVGAFRVFESVGLGVGHSIGAVIYDVTGSYRMLIVLLLVSYLISTLLICLSRPPTAAMAPPPKPVCTESG